MRNPAHFSGGRTRVFVRGVLQYVEGGNPRRTPHIGKITIYGWKLIYFVLKNLVLRAMPVLPCEDSECIGFAICTTQCYSMIKLSPQHMIKE